MTVLGRILRLCVTRLSLWRRYTKKPRCTCNNRLLAPQSTVCMAVEIKVILVVRRTVTDAMVCMTPKHADSKTKSVLSAKRSVISVKHAGTPQVTRVSQLNGVLRLTPEVTSEVAAEVMAEVAQVKHTMLRSKVVTGKGMSLKTLCTLCTQLQVRHTKKSKSHQ